MKIKFWFAWLLAIVFGVGLAVGGATRMGSALAAAYPDPTSDIAWSGGTSSVTDVQAAFNNARTQENAQLGTSIPLMTLPTQSEWNAMVDNQRAAWLIYRERVDRGIHALYGWEPNVVSVADAYAEYMLANDVFGHEADGHTPRQRMEANPVIAGCNDSYFSECLSIFGTSESSIDLPVERAIYAWLYNDSGSAWGHRHVVLRYPFNDNSGLSGMEGFFGLGRASGGPYQGPFPYEINFVEIIVLDLFDPCAAWSFYESFLPALRR